MDIYPEVELLDINDSNSNFQGNAKLFSTLAAAFFIPTSNVQGLQFLHILNAFLFFLNQRHPNRCEIVSHVGFDLHFPND